MTAIPAVGKFQSTLPTRGSDLFSLYFYSYIKISIHAPHEGERLELSTYPVMQYDFNPRSPRGGATHPGAPFWQACQYFNPRSPRGGATDVIDALGAISNISIHAPHEGERLLLCACVNACVHFNPRSPRGGATHAVPCSTRSLGFQSTLPTRGSDTRYRRAGGRSCYFNPRSPRGGATPHH